MGALFININTRMNFYRGKYLKTKWIKPIETFFWCFITASTFFWISYAPLFRKACKKVHEDKPEALGAEEAEEELYLIRGWCKKDEFNTLMTLFLSSEGEIIKNLLDAKLNITQPEIWVFFAVWYGYTCLHYGTNVPAGLFLPGMILGCCVGTIVG